MSTALSTTQHYPSPQQSPDAPDWKQLLAERLEAHRAKSGAQPPVSTPNFRMPSSSSRASNIARAVASRYAEQPTYSEIMAATLAEHAAQEAEAAEYAAVQANRAYSQQVHWEQEQEGDEHGYATDTQPELPLSAQMADPRQPEGDQEFQEQYGASYPTSGTAVMPKFAERSQEMRLHQSPKVAEPSLEELLASSLVEPRAYLPSKLIEFPRELVSANKARPRLPDPPVPAIPAEIVEQESSQLRIFEVQPEAASQTDSTLQAEISSPAREMKPEQPAQSNAPAKPAAERALRAPVSRMPMSGGSVGSRSTIPASGLNTISAHSSEADVPGVRTYKGLEWAAISLDKEPALYSRKRFATESDTAPSLIQPASIDRRVMAFAVDFAAVTGAFLGFLAVFAAATPRLPSGLTGIMLAAVVYGALWLLYQLMFFSLSGATAGMLYARIALCTFNDQNPSRSALRRRLAAWWLSCLPLGLGFFWSFLDEDNLSWHDRMTGMYQRTY
ncbi:MAG TPA: RDD family protein [Acidobacteriaceae bacterium]|nr:RDD family protein [Acidobacteriaceae bacterium]